MVKGVNQSIIEITQTGSKYFSKAILFVSPEYTDLRRKKLSQEALNALNHLKGRGEEKPLLRVRYHRRRKWKILLLTGGGAALVTALLLIFL